MFHGCLKKILQKLENFITEWDLVRCTDNYFRQVIYGIGPYIADYPEQVLVAGIVNGWCPMYVNPFPVPALTVLLLSKVVMQIQLTLITPVPSHELTRRGKSFFGRRTLTPCGFSTALSMISVCVSFVFNIRFN